MQRRVPAAPATVSRLRSTPRVAVIGAGVIGCTVAWRIRQALGFDVDLYERRHDILLETSAGTSNRLHYGYQYARSAETATSLREYHQQFQEVYGPCIVPSANYYGVADDSAISPAQYLDFCDRCDLPLEPKRPPGVFTDRVLLSAAVPGAVPRPGVAARALPAEAARLRRAGDRRHRLTIHARRLRPRDLGGLRQPQPAARTLPAAGPLLQRVRDDDGRAPACLRRAQRDDRVRPVHDHRRARNDRPPRPLPRRPRRSPRQRGPVRRRARRLPAVPVPVHPRRRPRRSHPAPMSPSAQARRYFAGLDQARHVASNFVVRVQAPNDVENAVRRTTIHEVRPGWFSISASKLSACVSIADTMTGLLQRDDRIAV